MHLIWKQNEKLYHAQILCHTKTRIASTSNCKKNRKLEFISNQFSLDKWRNRCKDPVMLCTGPTHVHVNNLMQIDIVHSICSITWWNGISIWTIDSLDDGKIQLATILIVAAWNPSENISAFLLRPYNH